MIRAFHIVATAVVVAAAAIGVAPTASADPMSDLIGMLPPGYAPDSCYGSSEGVPPQVVVSLDCHEVPGQVPLGRYELLADVKALNHQFTVDFKGPYFTALTCPGAPGIGPGTVTARTGWKGKLACGAIQSRDLYAVMWTNERGVMWARVLGPNLTDLWSWFGDAVVSS